MFPRIVYLYLFVIFYLTIAYPATKEICSPGDNKEIDCNNCYCADGDSWICTLLPCYEEQDKRCDLGEMNEEECHRCHCNRNFKWNCTYTC
ncbi:protease inhibitors-like [Onthophagus taurus]|uniref:protease inhibitors-like n=1 Tax=Onthophagus taurus TaxID=166361 RepID=UPI000C20C5FB|nr:serine protease inhibitor 3-like [Onthophagus taurus]